MVPPDLKPPAPRAVFLLGPTASGKTALAHALADALPVLALVNLDAFCFYKGVSAGTAKPSPLEIERYSYALVDFLEPPDRFDAQAYAALARSEIERLGASGRVPLCVGGSGLYLRALLHGLNDLPKADTQVRERLRAQAVERGWPALHARLAAVDPVRASELHPNDQTRIERALEVHELTGIPMSAQRGAELSRAGPPLAAYVVQVDAAAPWLRARIETRTRMIVGAAWRAEVEALQAIYGEDLSSFQSMQAIGYSQMIDAARGGREWDMAALQKEIALRTWQYARRQRTWNRKEASNAVWIAAAEERPVDAFADLVARLRESL